MWRMKYLPLLVRFDLWVESGEERQHGVIVLPLCGRGGLRVTESCHWEVDWLLLASCKRKKTWLLQPTRPVRQSESVCACECMRARVCLCTRPLYSLGHLMGLLDFSVMLVGFLLLLISDYCTQLLHIKMCVFLCVTCCEWNWNEYFHSVNKSHKGTFYLRVKGKKEEVGRGGSGRKG